jgi:amino acid transporter
VRACLLALARIAYCMLARRGAGKKKSTDPPPCICHLPNPRPTHPPTIRLFFPWAFFLVRFWAFLGKGSSKTPQKYFYKKSMSKTFSKKIENFVGVSFSSIFFCFIAFSGVSQRWEFKNTTKNILRKTSVEKFLQKNRPKI